MSVNTQILLAYGFIIDSDDESFLKSLVNRFPHLEGKSFKSICGDFNRFYWESESGYAEEIMQGYRHLEVRGVAKESYSEKLDKLVVVATASVDELWNKYSERHTNLAFDTNQGTVPDKVANEFFNFQAEFGLESKKPHPVIWYEYV